MAVNDSIQPTPDDYPDTGPIDEMPGALTHLGFTAGTDVDTDVAAAAYISRAAGGLGGTPVHDQLRADMDRAAAYAARHAFPVAERVSLREDARRSWPLLLALAVVLLAVAVIAVWAS